MDVSQLVQIAIGEEKHMLPMSYSLTTPFEVLKLGLIERLSNLNNACCRLQYFGPVFEYLPAHIGENEALDTSVRALLETHRLSLFGESGFRAKDLSRHTRALGLIQRDLNQLRGRAASTTVCAAIILALYEVRT